VPVRTSGVDIHSASGRIQNGKRSGIKRHPVTGEPSPLCRWRIRSAAAAGGFRHEEEEIEDSVSEESVDHVAHPVGRTLQDDLPEVCAPSVTNQPLRNEYRWKPHNEGADVENQERRRNGASHDRSNVNPQANHKSNG